jgi:TolA-binding protein
LPPLLNEYRADGETWSHLALRLAQSHLHAGDRPAAERLARRITDEQPAYSRRFEVDYLLGRCLADQGLLDDAREAYRRVVRSEAAGKSETAAMAQWMIGETYFHQHNHAAALREYLRVEILYAYPSWQAAALLQAGKCCEHLGQKEQAAEHYSRVAVEFSDSEFQDDAARRLRALRQEESRTERNPKR